MVRSKHLLKRIIAVQDTVIEHQKRGATQAWIYRNVVSSTFFISERTFNRYLCINAKKELKEIEHECENDKAAGK